MKKLTHDIFTYLKEREWDDLKPGDVAKSISIEAAELLELFQWTNPTLDEFKKDAEKIEVLKGELADVLIYALDLAVLLELDAEKLIRAKLDKITKKYPAHLFKNKVVGSKKHLDVYLEIKNAHRAKEAKKKRR